MLKEVISGWQVMGNFHFIFMFIYFLFSYNKFVLLIFKKVHRLTMLNFIIN